MQELVRDELLTRHSYAESPPRVEYRLTEKSKELVPIFQSMSEWGMYLIEKNTDNNTIDKNKTDTAYIHLDSEPKK